MRYEVTDRRNGYVLNVRENLASARAMADYWQNCEKAGEYRQAPAK